MIFTCMHQPGSCARAGSEKSGNTRVGGPVLNLMHSHNRKIMAAARKRKKKGTNNERWLCTAMKRMYHGSQISRLSNWNKSNAIQTGNKEKRAVLENKDDESGFRLLKLRYSKDIWNLPASSWIHEFAQSKMQGIAQCSQEISRTFSV